MSYLQAGLIVHDGFIVISMPIIGPNEAAVAKREVWAICGWEEIIADICGWSWVRLGALPGVSETMGGKQLKLGSFETL